MTRRRGRARCFRALSAESARKEGRRAACVNGLLSMPSAAEGKRLRAAARPPGAKTDQMNTVNLQSGLRTELAA